MKSKKTFYSLLSVAVVAVVAVLLATYTPRVRSVGSFTLRVNPQIRVSYNKDGNVTKVQALNEDGQKILDACEGVKGVPCSEAVDTLLNTIYSNGYFEHTIDGNQRNIVISMEPNSKMPSETFVDDLQTEAVKSRDSLQLNSNVVNVQEQDFIDQTVQQQGASQKCLSLEKAKAIALAQSGVNAADAKFLSEDLETKSGKIIYDLEFVVGNVKYEYDIDAQDGTVLKAEHSRRNVQKPNAPVEAAFSMDVAKEIALKHSGVSASKAQFDEKECEYSKKDGKYEIEFTDGKYVYSFDIDGTTGEILESEQKDAVYVAAEKAEEAKKDAEEQKKEDAEKAEDLKKDELDKQKDKFEDMDDYDDDDIDDDDDNDIDDDDDDDD